MVGAGGCDCPFADASENDPHVLSRQPFFEWCHGQYTDLDRGTVSLIAVYSGDRCAKRLVARIPAIKMIDLWTGVFARGNPGGPGNPLAKRTADVRRIVREAVTEEDVRAVVGVVVDKAKAGEPWAVKELLDRLIDRWRT